MSAPLLDATYFPTAQMLAETGYAPFMMKGHAMLWVWPIITLVLLAVFLLFTRSALWRNFAEKHKWPSRIALAVMIGLFIIPMSGTGALIRYQPMQIETEQPNLIATAIKLGMTGFQANNQLALKVPASQRPLYKCVTVASRAQAQRHTKSCGLSACKCPSMTACFISPHGKTPECQKQMMCIEDLTPSTREELFAFIAKVQSGEIRDESVSQMAEFCKDVKLPK